MQRRRFLQWGVLSSLASAWSHPLNAADSKPMRVPQKIPFSILQGATDETRTQFSVLYQRGQDLNFVAVGPEGQLTWPDRVEHLQFPGHSKHIAKPYFSGLKLGQEYHLLVANSAEEVLDKRFFKTLDLEQKNLRFTVASCMDETRHEPEIWQDMLAQNPDFVLFVGDSVYADRNRGSENRVTADPELLWRRFCHARETLEIFNIRYLVPIIATWDDHDFGKNDTGNSYPYINESQNNFYSFFAQDESHCRGLVRGPGVSSALIFQGQIFFLLDNRSFREKGASHDPYGHWGEEQMRWFYDLCETHPGFLWICNGSQIFPQMLFKESVSKEHPENLKQMVEFLKASQRGAAFISGDVHYSEVSQLEDRLLGYTSYEFTSSSIHSKSFPGVPDIIPNKRRIASTGRRNYLMIDSRLLESRLDLRVTSRSRRDRVNFEKELYIQV